MAAAAPERKLSETASSAAAASTARSWQGAALRALARNECAHWPRQLIFGTFYHSRDDEDGAALCVSEELQTVYRVLGISTSIGDLVRSSGRVLPTVHLLTLLPFMGKIIYDGTLRSRPLPPKVSEAEFAKLVDAAIARGAVLSTLPAPALEMPLVKARVVISGLKAREDFNGLVGRALSFSETTGRYEIELPAERVAVRPANLAEAAAAQRATADAAAHAGDEGSAALRKRVVERLSALPPMSKDAGFWTMRRMGYTEAENPNHELVIISGAGQPIFASGNSMVLRTRRLAPSVDKVVKALETAVLSPSVRGAAKPYNLAVDEQSIVAPLNAILGSAGVFVGYYPPPSAEELASMGMNRDHSPLF